MKKKSYFQNTEFKARFLNWLMNFDRTNTRMPTLREIMDGGFASSTSEAKRVLDYMQDIREIHKEPGMARGFHLTRCNIERFEVCGFYTAVCYTCQMLKTSEKQKEIESWIEHHKERK